MFLSEINFCLKSGKDNEMLCKINVFNEEKKKLSSYFQKKHIGRKKGNSISIMDLAPFSK